jgi:hypothetical protein
VALNAIWLRSIKRYAKINPKSGLYSPNNFFCGWRSKILVLQLVPIGATYSRIPANLTERSPIRLSGDLDSLSQAGKVRHRFNYTLYLHCIH